MSILIVEDELKLALYLKELIESNGAFKVAKICESIESTVNYLKNNLTEIDLIFMDIELTDGRCFEIFNHFKVTKPIVFCTAFEEFTIQAFKNNGIDYILKPFTRRDISLTFQKINQLQQSFNYTSLSSIDFQKPIVEVDILPASLLIRYREKILPVLVTDIAYVFLNEAEVNLFTFKGDKYQISKSIDEIEQSVSPAFFFRINRQTIVNRKAIKETEHYFGQKMIVHLSFPTAEKFLLSRVKVTPFLSWLENAQIG